MHTTTLLLLLSSIGAHAVPLFHARSNDTLARRDEQPYSVVNVGDETTSSQTPTVETITVANNPPQPPVTLTVTQTPSSTPAASASPSASGHLVPPGWSIPSVPTEDPESESGEDSQIAARGFNQTERAARNFRRSAVANSTVTRDLHARGENSTVSSELHARSNSTLTRDLHARSENTTLPELHARSNSTLTRSLHARGENTTTTSELHARSNSTLTRDLHARSENTTLPELHARSNNTLTRDLYARSENSTLPKLHARSNGTGLETRSLFSRGNDTESSLHARSANVTGGAGLFSRGALNATTLVGRSNSTVV
ncbi:uncharacterized protein KD926_001023 [Aspergillus affinis]|uniref:uncharacterized protein n=1 Tax=Aspergillus affinis TaxID=1070780 RepID=UPI0022FDFFAF|nr:uncharacterized protein KD926_001023 [Aspergillus affinis]KAI9044422.1 hypothetical protein KD926_001023 [Aspergillus affinis]